MFNLGKCTIVVCDINYCCLFLEAVDCPNHMGIVRVVQIAVKNCRALIAIQSKLGSLEITEGPSGVCHALPMIGNRRLENPPGFPVSEHGVNHGVHPPAAIQFGWHMHVVLDMLCQLGVGHHDLSNHAAGTLPESLSYVLMCFSRRNGLYDAAK